MPANEPAPSLSDQGTCTCVTPATYAAPFGPRVNVADCAVHGFAAVQAENEKLKAILDGCDDAAIERGADAARRAYHNVIDRRLLKELWPTVALAALRAAGERSVETDEVRDGD